MVDTVVDIVVETVVRCDVLGDVLGVVDVEVVGEEVPVVEGLVETVLVTGSLHCGLAVVAWN